MPLGFGRAKQNVSQPPTPPPPPPKQQVPQHEEGDGADGQSYNVWSVGKSGGGADGLVVEYTVRDPWQWIMNKVKTGSMHELDTCLNLPSAKAAAGGAPPPPTPASADGSGIIPMTPATRRRRNKNKERALTGPSTLRMEVYNPKTNEIAFAVHGISSALDGLEDKDELVRTIQRCRCEEVNLSPPSILLSWDVTYEECLNVVGQSLPQLAVPSSSKKNGSGNTGKGNVYAVLKEPMGSQGKGIFFVQNADEIHKVISEHRQLVQKDPAFLDNLIEQKGRIPSWVLQAEVVPPLLIRDRRKFHIRTYVVVVEEPENADLLEIYIYNRHELRVAGVPVKTPDLSAGRDPLAHITNGALSKTTERVLLQNEPEIVQRNIQKKLELFVAKVFGIHLLPDIARRVATSLRGETDDGTPIKKFVVAGLDLMVTEDNQIFLLEANLYPSAPPEDSVDDTFVEHLKGFFQDLINLVAIGNHSPNFLLAREILEENGV